MTLTSFQNALNHFTISLQNRNNAEQKQREDISTERKSYITTISQVKMENEQLRQTLEANKLEYQKLIQLLKETQSRVQETESNLAQTQTNANNLNQQHNELQDSFDQLKHNYDQLSVEFDENRKLNQKLKDDNQQLSDTITDLNKKWKALLEKRDSDAEQLRRNNKQEMTNVTTQFNGLNIYIY